MRTKDFPAAPFKRCYPVLFFILMFCMLIIIICISYVLQEEELRKGGEAKYAHLAMELHVFIEVMAPIPEAYLRMAHAMEEVKKFLIPVCVQENFLHPNL